MKPLSLAICVGVLVFGCTTSETKIQQSPLSQFTPIEGKAEYLASPYVTAGNRVYMIGHQDGSFPDLGWHITGEMGGIWNHPIKLMDGFVCSITLNNQTYCLDKATKFVNYPMANQHLYNLDAAQIKVERTQYVPDDVEGIVINFKITNESKAARKLKFGFTTVADLRPTWLGERTNMVDGKDSVYVNRDLDILISKDKNNPWYTGFGSTIHSSETLLNEECCNGMKPGANGANGRMDFELELGANESVELPVIIAGSYESEAALMQTIKTLRESANQKLQQKAQRYVAIQQKSKLTIPDKNIEQMYQWLKYNTDWLVRNVPTEGIGLSAGLPDYPWWFGCDNTYALQGALATGEHELTKNTIDLVYKISQRTNSNGRIIHEVSTNGAVFNPGNVNETAQFITLLNNYFNWTGDRETVSKYFSDVKKGMDWLTKDQDPDHNGYPNGNGMMEIHGLDKEMIDVVVYTQQALTSAGALARNAMGDTTLAKAYEQQAQMLGARINTAWWHDEAKTFGDFIGTVKETLPVIDAAIVRADTLGKPWAVQELKETKATVIKSKNNNAARVVYHNWVVNTPMETGVAEPEKAHAALMTARKYENAYGAFVTGIDRTEEADSTVLKSRKKIFSYVGAVMTLPTGVQAVGNARYNSPDDALLYIKKLLNSFSYALPGSMYEVSPDFGMITQAWNIYGVAVPIVNYFFGVEPYAYKKTTVLQPDLPTDWKNASLDNVKIGNNALGIVVNQRDDHVEYSITQTQADWSILFQTGAAKKVEVNGKEMDSTGGELLLTGLANKVVVYK